MVELNEKFVILTNNVEEQSENAFATRSDIHRMVDLLIEMVSIFRGEELPRESETEKNEEEVDPPNNVETEKEDLPEEKGNSKKEEA